MICLCLSLSLKSCVCEALYLHVISELCDHLLKLEVV